MLSWGVLGLSRGACCPTGFALPLFANDKQARSLSITGTLVRGEGGIGRSPLNLMKPNRNSSIQVLMVDLEVSSVRGLENLDTPP